MTQRKDLWWVAPASLALLVLICVSGAGNFQYGLDFGGPVIGGASIASDIMKVVALIGVFALWRTRHRLQAIALFVLFLGFTAWSMLSAVGFMSTQFASLEDNRGKTAAEWQTLTAQIDRLEERRRKVKAVRPKNTIQADIDSILRMPGVNGCAVIDGPITREQCPKLDNLKAELGHAEEALWLDGRLDELRKELRQTDRVSVVDPRTDSITAISTASAASVALFIKFFFAGLIELATALGLWAVWSPFFNRRTEAAQKPQEAPKADSGADTADEGGTGSEPQPDPSGGVKQDIPEKAPEPATQAGKPQLSVVKNLKTPDEIAAAWAREFAPPGSGRRTVTAKDARWWHSQWCDMAKVRKLAPAQLGTCLKKAGVQIDRSSGKGATYIFNPKEMEVSHSAACAA